MSGFRKNRLINWVRKNIRLELKTSWGCLSPLHHPSFCPWVCLCVQVLNKAQSSSSNANTLLWLRWAGASSCTSQCWSGGFCAQSFAYSSNLLRARILAGESMCARQKKSCSQMVRDQYLPGGDSILACMYETTDGMASNCWILGKTFSLKTHEALAQAA